MERRLLASSTTNSTAMERRVDSCIVEELFVSSASKEIGTVSYCGGDNIKSLHRRGTWIGILHDGGDLPQPRFLTNGLSWTEMTILLYWYKIWFELSYLSTTSLNLLSSSLIRCRETRSGGEKIIGRFYFGEDWKLVS